ncbi:MAG: patatin-like phospholipase family protein, partial [Pseudomonadota bacterium]
MDAAGKTDDKRDTSETARNAATQDVSLVLQGGGARAAYQVGVLKAVSEALGHPEKNPFPIIVGTSAGAI